MGEGTLGYWLMGRIERSAPLSASRAIWGRFYETVSYYRVLLVLSCVCGISILIVIFTGYISSNSRIIAAWNLPGFALLIPPFVPLFYPNLLYSPLLLPVGRRERFLRCVGMGLGRFVLALVSGFCLIAISHVIMPWMPPVTFHDTLYHYVPAPWCVGIWLPVFASLVLAGGALATSKNRFGGTGAFAPLLI
ncbi:TPA: hypothetical protein DDW35_03985, partial [Candidatus Sumerlaeota bacterium]|nr:hypothetical protein [Candidatus Sumerlaeota bacterium]